MRLLHKMNDYPNLSPDDEKDAKELLRTITLERAQDIKDFDNLQNRFMSGRKVGRIPTGASDISDTDRVGDFNYDFATGYYYLVVDNSGTAVWARVALDTGW